MQMNLTGFLYGSKARLFMKELWNHLSSAQSNISGIPTEFLEEKKEEIRQMKVLYFVVCRRIQCFTIVYCLEEAAPLLRSSTDNGIVCQILVVAA